TAQLPPSAHKTSQNITLPQNVLPGKAHGFIRGSAAKSANRTQFNHEKQTQIKQSNPPNPHSRIKSEDHPMKKRAPSQNKPTANLPHRSPSPPHHPIHSPPR